MSKITSSSGGVNGKGYVPASEANIPKFEADREAFIRITVKLFHRYLLGDITPSDFRGSIRNWLTKTGNPHFIPEKTNHQRSYGRDNLIAEIKKLKAEKDSLNKKLEACRNVSRDRQEQIRVTEAALTKALTPELYEKVKYYKNIL